MDLKVFYQKLRKLEQEIGDPHVVVVSHETPDGGREGRKSEVPRNVAAKLILGGRARLATPEEATEYRTAMETALRAAEQKAMAEKVQVNLITEAELRAIRAAPRAEKR
jgi:hypothetical protein